MLKHKRDLYFVNFDKKNSYKEIIKIINDKEKFNKMREQSFKTLKSFSWENKIDSIISLYNTVITYN